MAAVVVLADRLQHLQAAAVAVGCSSQVGTAQIVQVAWPGMAAAGQVVLAPAGLPAPSTLDQAVLVVAPLVLFSQVETATTPVQAAVQAAALQQEMRPRTEEILAMLV